MFVGKVFVDYELTDDYSFLMYTFIMQFPPFTFNFVENINYEVLLSEIQNLYDQEGFTLYFERESISGEMGGFHEMLGVFLPSLTSCNTLVFWVWGFLKIY